MDRRTLFVVLFRWSAENFTRQEIKTSEEPHLRIRTVNKKWKSTSSHSYSETENCVFVRSSVCLFVCTLQHQQQLISQTVTVWVQNDKHISVIFFAQLKLSHLPVPFVDSLLVVCLTY